MAAESAFVGLAGVVIDEACVIRTSLDAVGATNAAVAIDQHDAVRAFEGGADRANRNARRFLAVIAKARQHGQAGLAGLVSDGVGGDDSTELPFTAGKAVKKARRERSG